MRGMSFGPAALGTPYMGIWKRCSASWIITEHGDEPTNFCGMRLNLLISLWTKTLIHSPRLFAARVMGRRIIRRLANGRARCGMRACAEHLQNAKGRGLGEHPRPGLCVKLASSRVEGERIGAIGTA